jgi:hypothetical protein
LGPVRQLRDPEAITGTELLTFVRTHRLAVQSSLTPSGASQSAVVGIATSDNFEIVFDTLASTRKAQNLRHNPNISLVVGGLTPGDERTVQYDGLAIFRRVLSWTDFASSISPSGPMDVSA